MTTPPFLRLGPGQEQVGHCGRRGARPARREERAYRAYVSDAQRSPAGCIGGHSDQLVPDRVLNGAGDESDDNPTDCRLPNGICGMPCARLAVNGPQVVVGRRARDRRAETDTDVR